MILDFDIHNDLDASIVDSHIRMITHSNEAWTILCDLGWYHHVRSHGWVQCNTASCMLSEWVQYRRLSGWLLNGSPSLWQTSIHSGQHHSLMSITIWWMDILEARVSLFELSLDALHCWEDCGIFRESLHEELNTCIATKFEIIFRGTLINYLLNFLDHLPSLS